MSAHIDPELQAVMGESALLIRQFAPGPVWRSVDALIVSGADTERLRSAIEAILRADKINRQRNAIASPARAALQRIRAELLLRSGCVADAMATAKIAVALEPHNNGNLETLRKCLERVPKMSHGGCVVLIISCDGRQTRCAALYEQLAREQWPVRVVCGAGSTSYLPYNYLTVAAGDSYEDLAHKVRDALVAVFETYGEGVAVLKLDDDLTLNNPASFARFWKRTVEDATVHYGGFVASKLTIRDWHFNKCSDPSYDTMPFGRKADWPYAHGPCYFLSSTAVASYYYYNMMFPDECSGFWYEDVFMGYVMRESGIEVSPIDLAAFGIEHPSTRVDSQ